MQISAYITSEYIKDCGTPSRYSQVSKDLKNDFIKSESLFDPFGYLKRHFSKFWPISAFFDRLRFSLISSARARQYTQNDCKEHLCRKPKK